MESTRVGQCLDCRHARVVVTRAARYYRCARAATDARYPKYPRLPVTNCGGYEAPVPAAAGQSSGTATGGTTTREN